MFGIGMPELIIIFVIALLIFGPKELPKIGRTIGKAMGEFRRASDELRDGIQREIDLAEREEKAPPVAEESPIPGAAKTMPPASQGQTGDDGPEADAAVAVAPDALEDSQRTGSPTESGEPSQPTEITPHPAAQPAETRNA
jgi:TatA/E family protein of Tat protein translocase